MINNIKNIPERYLILRRNYFSVKYHKFAEIKIIIKHNVCLKASRFHCVDFIETLSLGKSQDHNRIFLKPAHQEIAKNNSN